MTPKARAVALTLGVFVAACCGVTAEGVAPTPYKPVEASMAPVVVSAATPAPTARQRGSIAAVEAPTAKPKPVGSLAAAKAYARERLGATQYACLDNLVTRESRWRVTATNLNSGAYGLPQALPGRKMAKYGDDWRTNPVTQLRWMIAYVNGRYGSACAAWRFWQANRWY